MKILRRIGPLAFVLGLFFAIFAGIPWYVIISDDPAMPWWLKIALFSTLGGILAVLLTVALEQRKTRKPDAEAASTEPDRAILMLNSWYTARLSNSVIKSYCKIGLYGNNQLKFRYLDFRSIRVIFKNSMRLQGSIKESFACYQVFVVKLKKVS